MSKKNHRKKYREKWFEEKPKEPRLHPETKKSIWAIVFLGIAAVLILASFKSAGPFGNFLYLFFEKLFGRGYYLLPAIFLVLAGVFLTSERQRIYQITFLGAGLFTLAAWV